MPQVVRLLPFFIEVQTEICRQSVLAPYSFAFKSMFFDPMFAERMPVRKVTPVSFLASNVKKDVGNVVLENEAWTSSSLSLASWRLGTLLSIAFSPLTLHFKSLSATKHRKATPLA